MSSRRAAHALSVLGLIALGFTTAPAASAATPTPKPEPLPAAQSWVGGRDLIGTRTLLHVPAGVPAPPAPAAASWLIADLDTRQILAGRRVHVPLAPASTLKIFTGLALAHRLDPKQVYTGRPDDAAVDGTKAGIVAGSRYTVNDLLHGMLMSSGNDCANALGNAVGGTRTAIGMIQDEAQQLGAFDTVVHTTNGLDATGQVSSAYDLALAGSAALTEPQLSAIMTTKMYPFPGAGKSMGKKRAHFEIQNHNRMLRNYPGSTGVKNGYTIAAHGSFVGSATRNGHSYLAVVMRADGSTWHETTALLDWAFTHGSQATPVGVLVKPGELAAMVGPGHPEAALSAATSTPSPAASAGDSGNSLRGALPSVQTSLSKPAADGRNGKLVLAGASLALVLLALVAGRRPIMNLTAGRNSRRSPSDSRTARTGRHRG